MILLFLTGFGLSLNAQNPCEAAAGLHRQGEFIAAIAQYEACLKVLPADVQARSNFGAALAHEGRYAEAIEQDRLALATAPAIMAVPLRLNLALAYYKSARIPEATGEFGSVLQQDPTNRRAAILLAECHLMMGAPAKSVAILQPLDAANPNDFTVTYLLGSALLRSGDVQSGQRILDRILRNGESAEGHMLLGVTMFQAGDYPGAVREFARTESLKPDLPSLESYYGQALLNTGDANGAENAFRRQLIANGADFESNLRLGQIHLARKQFDEARPLLEKAIQIRPQSEEAVQSLADARNHKAPAPGPAEDGPQIGSAAPAFTLRSVRTGASRSLAELHRTKPVIAIFGSYTCPQLRAAIPALNQLYAKFQDRVTFALIYVSEAHGSGSWQSSINERDRVDLPTERNAGEKQEHAALCLRKLAIPYEAFVDTMDRATEKAYSAWPSRVFVIGQDGTIRFQTRLTELDFDRDALEHAIGALVPGGH